MTAEEPEVPEVAGRHEIAGSKTATDYVQCHVNEGQEKKT